MDLNELNKRLYKQEDGIEDRPEAPEIYSPGHQNIEPTGQAPQWSESDSKKFKLANIERKIFWIASGLLILAAAGVAVWFFWLGSNSFDTSKVALNIYGQDRLVSGEEVGYIVRLKNNTNVTLNNVVLDFSFPSQALPVDQTGLAIKNNLPTVTKTLTDLAPGSETQFEFRARIFGEKDSRQALAARVSYRPANINSSFGNTSDFASTIISVPLVLNFDLPEKIVSGQTINFDLKYLNTSDVAFSNSQIQVDYPDGFVFDSAFPTPSSGNNTWSISAINSQEEGQLLIKGILNGTEGESKTFKARIGVSRDNTFIVYAQALISPQIALSPLFVEQILDQSAASSTASLGQVLNYKLKYKNTTDVTISPVVLIVKIDSQAVDWSSVNVTKGGFFNSVDDTISWNTASLPELNSLSSGQEGQVEFSLHVKNKLPIKNFSDKNFKILTTAQIDSPNVPLSLTGTQLKGVNQVVVKINSRLALNVKGFYTDTLMPNSGPLPPRVGQATTYTIYLQLLNDSNDLSEVIVEAYLPSYVQWQSKIYPADENVKYDISTGKITWQVNKLSSATGVLSPVRQAVFQVSFTPSISQSGSNPVLVSQAKASGLDTFTGLSASASALDLKTDLPDDPTVGWANGRVE